MVRSADGGRVYVHRRTTTKAVFAGMHDCLAGGVVDPGESPEQTATRELAEELGITGVPLTALTSVAWDGQWAGNPMRCHLFAYQIHYDGPIDMSLKEIADGWWWTDAELVAHLADPDWPFVPDTRMLVPALIPELRGLASVLRRTDPDGDAVEQLRQTRSSSSARGSSAPGLWNTPASSGRGQRGEACGVHQAA